MASAKKKTSKRRTKAPSETRLGRVELKLERVDTQFATIVEGMQAMREEFTAAHDQLRADFAAEIQPLVLAIKAHSVQIQELTVRIERLEQRMGVLEQRMDDLGREVHQLKAQLTLVVSIADYDRLEKRVAAIEARLGIE